MLTVCPQLFFCDGPGPHCAAGQYRCPLSNHCVDGAAGYLHCPGLAGTHLDHTLGTEERVGKLIAAANLTEMIGQLTNAAPPLEALGIPAYNWLSDDEHGVRGWDSTYFPDGPGLGASFDKKLLYAVGSVVGLEARERAANRKRVCGGEHFFDSAGSTFVVIMTLVHSA